MPTIDPSSPTAAIADLLNNAKLPPPPGGVPSSTTSQPGQLTDKNTFLKLLVAQLKYQDPMNPADSTQMLAQSAQFAMVEQLDNIASQSADQLSATKTLLAGGLIGAQVTMGSSSGADVSGIVTGMRLTADGPLLKVDGQELNLSQLKGVDRDAAASTTQSPGTPSAGTPTAASTQTTQRAPTTAPTTTTSTTTSPTQPSSTGAPATAGSTAVSNG